MIDEIARYDAFEEILLLASHQAEHVLAGYAGPVMGRSRPAVALVQKSLGTAGALVQAAGLLQPRFLLLNGASFFDFNLFSIWCGVQAPASFLWRCAPELPVTDSTALTSTTTRLAHSSRPARRNRSGRRRPSKLKWIDGVRTAVNDAGYFAFVVSNQSGVERGFFEESDVRALNRWMAGEMALIGGPYRRIRVLPGSP
jgi:hypothetical protein